MLLLQSIVAELAQTGQLALFLTAAIWLAELAHASGLARRVAGLLWTAARGRAVLLYLLVCGACAALTATVSLDGAVVLMVPLLLALAGDVPELLRPLLLATVVVANVFSLALPQGNPTNVVVMERVGLSPGAFVAHLFVPALVATIACVAALALVERSRLRALLAPRPRARGSVSAAERRAGLALAAAALAGAVGPWLAVGPWWSLAAVAAPVYGAARLRRRAVPPLSVPWRVCALVAALLVAARLLGSVLQLPRLEVSSPAALIALAVAAGAAASVINNLPASAVLAGLLGGRGLGPYAVLVGLSAGALATRHGSVATLIAFDRAGVSRRRYARAGIPAALLATVAAILCIVARF